MYIAKAGIVYKGGYKNEIIKKGIYHSFVMVVTDITGNIATG